MSALERLLDDWRTAGLVCAVIVALGAVLTVLFWPIVGH